MIWIRLILQLFVTLLIIGTGLIIVDIGDYYFFKREFVKSKEAYSKILSLRNLHQDIYNHAKIQLSSIIDD